MAKTLDIIDKQLELGQVKTIRTGEYLDYVELLFSPTTKVQFAPSEDRKTVRLSVSDNTLQLPQLDCLITKEVLRNYIINLKNIYNQLEDEEENT
ncbi:MAG: hypothetical protein HDT22_10490 [Ruminococcus sp.]|nr:hypothetical protein [Ruminococcus sp.]